MEIMPISLNSVPKVEAKTIAPKLKEAEQTEKFEIENGETKEATTKIDDKKEQVENGPNALPSKPDFPYQLISAVVFPPQAPIAITGEPENVDLNASGETISLDSDTAFFSPVQIAKPTGAPVPFGFQSGFKGADDVQQFVDGLAKPDSVFASKKLQMLASETSADIDLSNFFGTNELVGKKLELPILPNAVPQPTISPAANSAKADIEAKLAALAESSSADTMNWANVDSNKGSDDVVDPKTYQLMMESLGNDVADEPSADTFDWKNPPVTINDFKAKFDSIKKHGLQGSDDVADWKSLQAGVKADPADTFDWSNTPSFTGVSLPKKLSPEAMPCEEDEAKADNSIGFSGAPKKLAPIASPVENLGSKTIKQEDADRFQWPDDQAVLPTDDQVGSDFWKQNIEPSFSPLQVNDSLNTSAEQIGSGISNVTNITGSGKTNESGSKISPLPAAATNRLVEVVADRLEAIAAANPRKGITINLRPHDLGSITLVVKNSGSEVGAEVYASNESVRAALDSNRPLLSQHLQAKGLNLSTMTIADSSFQSSTSTASDTNAHRAHQETVRQHTFRQFAEPSSNVDPIQFLRKGKADGVDYWI